MPIDHYVVALLSLLIIVTAACVLRVVVKWRRRPGVDGWYVLSYAEVQRAIRRIEAPLYQYFFGREAVACFSALSRHSSTAIPKAQVLDDQARCDVLRVSCSVSFWIHVSH